MNLEIRPCPPVGLFVGSRARGYLEVNERELYSPAWRRILRDVYVSPESHVDHLVRCYGAALIAPPQAMITGRSAACLYGIEVAGADDPVELVVPEQYRFGPVRGLRIHRGPIRNNEFISWEGMRLATPTRMALDLLFRQAPRTSTFRWRLQDAVADLDQILRAELVDTETLGAILKHRHDHGVVLARQAVQLADPRAESPPESHLRVLMHLNDLHPIPQHTIYDNAGFVGRTDFAFLENMVAVEYNGAHHLEPEQAAEDELRLRRLQRAGWRVLVVDSEMLYKRPEELTQEIHRLICPIAAAA